MITDINGTDYIIIHETVFKKNLKYVWAVCLAEKYLRYGTGVEYTDRDIQNLLNIDPKMLISIANKYYNRIHLPLFHNNRSKFNDKRGEFVVSLYNDLYNDKGFINTFNYVDDCAKESSRHTASLYHGYRIYQLLKKQPNVSIPTSEIMSTLKLTRYQFNEGLKSARLYISFSAIVNNKSMLNRPSSYVYLPKHDILKGKWLL